MKQYMIARPDKEVPVTRRSTRKSTPGKARNSISDEGEPCVMYVEARASVRKSMLAYLNDHHQDLNDDEEYTFPETIQREERSDDADEDEDNAVLDSSEFEI